MAQIIDGSLIAKEIRQEIAKQVEQYIAQGYRRPAYP